MKKLKLLFAVIFMVAAIISCDKRNIELRIESVPEYTGTAILAEPILGPGGNISCEELEGDFNFSTGRINFVNGTFDFSDANTADWPEGVDPITGWPNGLSISVSEDGRYVSFTFTSDNYCVGAVIVKGGNSANVYTYDPAVKEDAGLRSPDNPNGLPAALSNLTFCFVKCTPAPGFVVGFKSYMYPSGYVTTGSFITAYDLILPSSYKLYYNTVINDVLNDANAVGYLKVTDTDHDGYWEITVDNSLRPDLHFKTPYLFVGKSELFNWKYNEYPYPDPKVILGLGEDSWTFELPFTLP